MKELKDRPKDRIASESSKSKVSNYTLALRKSNLLLCVYGTLAALAGLYIGDDRPRYNNLESIRELDRDFKALKR